jgi:hypothetical protein
MIDIVVDVLAKEKMMSHLHQHQYQHQHLLV